MDQSTTIRFDDALALQADATPRLDIYGAVHKGLRAFMFDTLGRVGRCDAGDARELADTLAQTRLLLKTLRHHLRHENGFVHPMLEAAQPGSSAITADDHVGHEETIATLEQAIELIGLAAPARRAASLYRFYLKLAHFVAENLEHMEIEETHNTALLRRAYDDAEIGAMLRQLIAAIAPDAAAVFHRWMYAAMAHDERAGMLGEIRAQAPAAVFEAEIERARSVLSTRDWDKLAVALELPRETA